MKELEVKSEIGVIKYKAPNIPQRLRLLSKLGVTPQGASGIEFDFDLFADIIEHVETLVTSVDIKVGSKKIESWEDCLEYEECTDIVMKLATDILSPPQSSEKKQKKDEVKK